MNLNSLQLLIATVPLLIWVYLALGNGFYWITDLDKSLPTIDEYPAVAVIVPARNEEETIYACISSILGQYYPGLLSVFVVDDESEDETALRAYRAADTLNRVESLHIIRAKTRPEGWVGKVWAMQQGLEAITEKGLLVQYVLFCDADIHLGSEELRRLIERSQRDKLDLNSNMVLLKCDNQPEKWMIPAFVYFFKMLYPFRRVNDPRNKLAGAAGGTMLLRWDALQRIGGFHSMKDAMIDDCTLARLIKRGGNRIWLSLTRESHSLRGYANLSELINMVARSAYTQLDYSPLKLVGCCIGLFITYLFPFMLLFTSGWAVWLGRLACLILLLLYIPIIKFYKLAAVYALTLPLTAAIYLYATVLSAIRYHTGKGGAWKGRTQAPKV